MTLDPSNTSQSGSPQIFNRTGSATAPEEAAEMVTGSTVLPPSSDGDDQAIAAMKFQMEREAPPIGTMPSPAPVAGKSPAPELLMDKLGERLAFERMGTRLYDAMLAKADARGELEPPGPTREELLHIRNEEAEHYILVAAALRKLGGDPTAVTPCADVQAVASMGLNQVVCDPRTTVAQALEALLIAELADNDAWATLITLSREAGVDEPTVMGFENARASEHEHLLKVRRWVKEAAEARLAAGTPPDAQRTGTDD
jgi:hypothetical protein